MSTFKKTPELYGQVDYQIIRDGFIRFYKSIGELGNDSAWLGKAGYSVTEFNCHGISNLLEQFNEFFHFPSYFRNNLDALNDCLEDIEISHPGLVIVLKNLDNLKRDDSSVLLEILLNRARLNFIMGERMLILVQAADDSFRIEQLKLIPLEQQGKNDK
jgi:RNAse (barnase) inhibitor barstar